MGLPIPEKFKGRAAVAPKEAAEILGIDNSTFHRHVYGNIRNGKIKSIKIGSRVCIFIDSLLEWAEKQADEQASQ